MTGPYNILHSTAGLHMGGVGRLLLNNIRNLDRGRFRSHVCYVRPSHDLRDEFVRAGVEPVCLELRNKALSPLAVMRLVRLIRAKRIDLVHTNHPLDHLLAGTAARICRVPLIATLHYPVRTRAGLLSVPRTRALLLRFVPPLARAVLADRYVAVSQAVKRSHAEYRSVPASRVTVIYPAVPAEHSSEVGVSSREPQLRSELGLTGEESIILNVGRLHGIKGQHHLIPMMARVAARWPNARLLIAGEGERRQALEEAIERHGFEGKVTLLGQREDVNRLLAICDVFISSSEQEGFGIAIAEAMGAGKPVVATPGGATPELVESGVSGYLTASSDPDELAEAVLALLDEPERAAAMGERGRRLARKRFGVATSVRSLEEVYQSVLDARADAGPGAGSPPDTSARPSETFSSR